MNSPLCVHSHPNYNTLIDIPERATSSDSYTTRAREIRTFCQEYIHLLDFLTKASQSHSQTPLKKLVYYPYFYTQPAAHIAARMVSLAQILIPCGMGALIEQQLLVDPAYRAPIQQRPVTTHIVLASTALLLTGACGMICMYLSEGLHKKWRIAPFLKKVQLLGVPSDPTSGLDSTILEKKRYMFQSYASMNIEKLNFLADKFERKNDLEERVEDDVNRPTEKERLMQFLSTTFERDHSKYIAARANVVYNAVPLPSDLLNLVLGYVPIFSLSKN
ncbi:MAG: hypothetical protein JWO53_371 [Chlamydiia bacterium]|nr:hypothetical protein [Chlamydiia bacterium]